MHNYFPRNIRLLQNHLLKFECTWCICYHIIFKSTCNKLSYKSTWRYIVSYRQKKNLSTKIECKVHAQLKRKPTQFNNISQNVFRCKFVLSPTAITRQNKKWVGTTLEHVMVKQCSKYQLNIHVCKQNKKKCKQPSICVYFLSPTTITQGIINEP